MDTRTREQKLCDLLAAEEDYVPFAIEAFLYRRKQVRLGSVLRSLMGTARVRAIHAYYVKNDISAFKQNAYLATRLSLASVGQDGGSTFEVADDLFYALLSDSSGAINAMAAVEVPQLLQSRMNPLHSRFYVYMLQMAIRGENEIVQQMIRKVATNGRKPERIEAAAGRDFFSLLLKRDQAGLEERIKTKHAKPKNQDVETENFLSFFGTLEAKLCWLKGIPVQIDSPWVPMELMPVQPLDHYDDVYDFLKPEWVPPRQGLFGKISRWLSSD